MMRDIYHIDRAARERILDEQTRKRIKQNWRDSWVVLVAYVVLLTMAVGLLG